MSKPMINGAAREPSWRRGPEHYRYARSSDLGHLATMLADEEVAQWLWFAPLDEAGVRAFFTPYIDAQRRVLAQGSVPLTAVFIVSSPEGTYLGMGAVVEVEGSPAGFELGFQLSRAAWGRGVGTRLAEFLAAYAIFHGNAFRLEASCLEGNAASQRILRRLGLELEGTRVAYRLKQGERHTELEFGVRVADLDAQRFAELAALHGLENRAAGEGGE